MRHTTEYIVSGSFKVSGDFLYPVLKPAIGKMRDGSYIIAGGENESGDGITTVSKYDPKTDTFSYVNFSLIRPIKQHAYFTCGDSRLVLVGGTQEGEDFTCRSERIDMDIDGNLFLSSGGGTINNHILSTGQSLIDGRGLVNIGILDADATTSRAIEIYDFKNDSFFVASSNVGFYRILSGATVSSENTCYYFGGGFNNVNLISGDYPNVTYIPTLDYVKSLEPIYTPRFKSQAFNMTSGDLCITGGVGTNETIFMTSQIYSTKHSVIYTSATFNTIPLYLFSGSSDGEVPIFLGGKNSSGFNTKFYTFSETKSTLPRSETLIFGGKNATNNFQNVVYKFITGLQAFKMVGTLPKMPFKASAFVVDKDKIVITAFEDEEHTIGGITYIYDSILDSVSLSGNVTTSRYNGCGMSLNGGCVVGGRTTSDYSSAVTTVDVYNYTTRSFSVSQYSVPIAVSAHKGDNIENMAYIMGGVFGSPAMTDKIYKSNNLGSWSELGCSLVNPITGHSVSVHGGANNYFLISGGTLSLSGNSENSVYILNPVSESVSSTTDMISARREHISFRTSDKYTYICGGVGESGDILNSVEAYHPLNNSRYLIDSMPIGLYGAVVVSGLTDGDLKCKAIDYTYYAGNLTSDEYHSGSVSVELSKGDYKTFDIQTQIGHEVRVTLWLKKNSDYTDSTDVETNPMIILVGDGENVYIRCDDISDTSWVQKTIAGIPLKDGIMRFIVFNKSTIPTAKLYIDDVSLL